jgi:hypothetical protein
MDIKDILLQNENSLPTITDTAGGSPSTTSVSGQATTQTDASTGTGSLPTFSASASSYWKFGASGVVGLLGAYYLASGKKANDFNKMVIGAVLTLASFFLF